MSDIFAMRRANGDWFALENYGRTRVPLFHSSHDAIMARLRNSGMLVFKPVALNKQTLNEMASAAIDFCMINDPYNPLSRGSQVTCEEVLLLMNTPFARPTQVR
jgi:uncharacterized phosphosugar-binding protein